jgi:hypothetical protein
VRNDPDIKKAEWLLSKKRPSQRRRRQTAPHAVSSEASVGGASDSPLASGDFTHADEGFWDDPDPSFSSPTDDESLDSDDDEGGSDPQVEYGHRALYDALRASQGVLAELVVMLTDMENQVGELRDRAVQAGAGVALALENHPGRLASDEDRTDLNGVSEISVPAVHSDLSAVE